MSGDGLDCWDSINDLRAFLSATFVFSVPSLWLLHRKRSPQRLEESRGQEGGLAPALRLLRGALISQKLRKQLAINVASGYHHAHAVRIRRQLPGENRGGSRSA